MAFISSSLRAYVAINDDVYAYKIRKNGPMGPQAGSDMIFNDRVKFGNKHLNSVVIPLDVLMTSCLSCMTAG